MALLSKQGVSTLFLQYQPDLMQFLTYKVSCSEIAADLTQETYLRIADRTDLDKIDNIKAYLFRIANNLALDHLRSRTRQLKREGGELNEDIASTDPEPETILADQQQIEFLQQAIVTLPPKCREVFLLCRVEGKSYAEVAAELSISRRTVESHIRKAMIHIRKQFT